MTIEHISPRIAKLLHTVSPIIEFTTTSTWAHRVNEPGICDFALGNPHKMPLSTFVEALQRATVPQNKDWYSYKINEASSQRIVAA